MNTEKARRFVDNLWDDEIVPTLSTYIEIPNKSPAFDRDWVKAGYMHDAAKLFERAGQRIPVNGAITRIVELPHRTPLLLVDVPASGGCDGNILCYGHYDKQPEFTGWHDGLGPWQPVIRNDRLYGRGGADDGYALFAALTAIATLDEQGLPHPRCCILIEGCEESGSFDLPFYIDVLQAEIGKPDLLICLDAECGNYDQLWLTTSLRGMVSGTLSAQVLTEGIHSGAAGGIVPSSFRVLRNIIERVENAETGELISALHCPIPPHIHDEVQLAAVTLGETVIDRYPWHERTRPAEEKLEQLLLRNTWYPSLATVGIGGAPDPDGAGNTLRPNTSAKLVFRLPPDVNAKDAAAALQDEFENNPPYDATVSFDVDASESGWSASKLSDSLLESLNKASLTSFGQPMRQMGCGGTIPFMAMLGRQFPNCEFIVTGVLGPHSNAHGPNEFLDIQTGKNVTLSIAAVLSDVAQSSKETG